MFRPILLVVKFGLKQVFVSKKASRVKNLDPMLFFLEISLSLVGRSPSYETY